MKHLFFWVFVFPGPRPFSWPPAPIPGPGPQFVFTDPGPQFVFTGPGPKFVFTGPGPQFVFTGPGPQFVFTSPGPDLVFTGPGTKFVFTGPGPHLVFTPNLYLPAQPGAWVCIYRLRLPNLYLLSLWESIQVHLSKIERTLNKPTTKFYNGDDVNVTATELRLTKTRPTSFSKKHNLL